MKSSVARRNVATHIPSNRSVNDHELLLRNPLTQGYTPTKYQSKSFLYSRNVQPEMTGTYHKEILEDNTPVTSFYTRHNPHPIRVKHLKGLLDNPVCMVEDNLERRLLWSAPSGDQIMAAAYRPQGNTRYSANRTKHIPAVGIVPVTYAWKDELEKKAHNAISKALGQTPLLPVIQPQQGYMAADNSTKHEFDSLDDNQLLNMLCKILQTDSIPACQAWLQNASDTEKMIVLNMLRMAATGEINQLAPNSSNMPNQQSSRPSTGQSVYIWNPHNSQHGGNGGETKHHLPPVNQPPPDHTHHLEEIVDDGLFKLPVHDTIIRSAQSRLSMKHNNGEPQSFHDRLQNELDKVETRRLRTSSSRGSAINNGRLHSASNRSRPTSAGLLPPPPAVNNRPVSQSRTNRPRSRSAGSSASRKDYNPPPLHQNTSKPPAIVVNVSSALRPARAM